MKQVFEKLSEAAQIRSSIANQEAAFWDKVSEALEEFSDNRTTFQEAQGDHPHPSKPIKPSGYHTTKEAAEYLSMAEGTLSVWRVTGFGPKFAKIGSNVRYKVEDLDFYVNENTFPHTTAYLNKKQ